jgi:hypothetical protein
MKTFAKIVALAVFAMLVATTAYAQGPAAGGSGQFAQFREEHKFTFQLMQMVRHIGDIDRDPKHALTPAQAKKVLAVLRPLRSKSKLTQDQAKQALKSLKVIFTVDQLNAMAKIKAPQRFGGGQRPGGGPPGGFGRPSGGPGGPGGNRPAGPRMDPARMKDFNPFYTNVDKSDPHSVSSAKRWDDFFSKLDAKAKQTKATPAKAPAKPKAKK